MRLHFMPVGPLPAGTYWRRRAFVLGGLLLALVLLRSCATGDEEPQERLVQSAPATSAGVTTTGPAPGPAAGPPTSAAPQPTVAPALCPDTALSVSAASERPRYDAGSAARLTLGVRNRGAVACSRLLGPGALEVLVYSGPDRIWSSDDCAPPNDPPGPRVLQPGELFVDTTTWPGQRSLPGCSTSAARPEPGTYRVVARVGELREEGRAFQLVD